MSETIESLEKALHDARKVRYEVEGRYEARKSELYREACEKVNAELGGSLNLAKTAESNASEALGNAENAERLAGASSKLPYPEGTIVCGWKNSRSPWAAHCMNRTGKRGMIEVYKEGDAYPSNRSRWSLPKVGDIVVRMLKKDGSKGIEVEKYIFDDYAKDYWMPEGVEPKCNKKA
jgi:hypothetical protein